MAELVLYGTKEIPSHALSGPRVYPQEYRKKSLYMPGQSSENTDASLQLRALVDDVQQNWI